MGRTVFAIYKPNEGKEDELLELIKVHTPLLFKEGLLADKSVFVLKAKQGEIIEVFKWSSLDAINQAHASEKVMALWNRFGEICTYQNLKSLAEIDSVFPDFELLNISIVYEN